MEQAHKGDVCGTLEPHQKDATVKTTRTRKHMLCRSAHLHAGGHACGDRVLPTLRGRQL